ncbi:MAG: hypothetical protein RL154_217, partial [Pseudomonadota bacterium]
SRDSEHIIAELNEEYETTNQAQDADLILINTCSVREKPVQKLFSEIGQFKKLKKAGAKLGVCGCTASHLGKEIISRAPVVDFVLGARNISKIKHVINTPKSVEIDIDFDDSGYMFGEFRENQLKSFVNISIGCDKECAFCIVPHTRGGEISIPSRLILDEVKKAVDFGAKEIHLLGQNVNNYGRRFTASGEKIDFTGLLQEVSKIYGVEIIRFSSPHPLHADDEFIKEFANNPKIAKHMHFPLQSGSDNILKLMRRGYTQEWFLKKVAKIRELCPEATIGTDIICGFPGESDEDFEQTLKVVEAAKFEIMFSFVYSPRPLTRALDLPNQVEDAVKKDRLKRLQALQGAISEQAYKEQNGKTLTVLFETDEGEHCYGKTGSNYTVRVPSDKSLVGKICQVKISKAKRACLYGTVL